MPQLILTISDTLAQALASLEDLDGQTPDQRYAKYHADVLQNEARVDAANPGRAAARLAELAEDATVAKQARGAVKKAAREMRALDLPVAAEGILSETEEAAT